MEKSEEIKIVAMLRLAYQQGSKDCIEIALDAVERGVNFAGDAERIYKQKMIISENDFIRKTMRGME